MTTESPVRRPQACERCWKRKQKCDRRLPTCGNCIEVNAECAARHVSVEFTMEEGTGLSHAALPGYIESLKRKADDLHDQREQQRLRVSNASPIPVQTATPQTSDVAVSQADDMRAREQSVEAAMGEIGLLSRNAMAEPRDKTNNPKELAMGNIVQAALDISGEDPSRSSYAAPHSRRIATMIRQTDILNREFALPYLDRFLDHVAVIFLHIEPTRARQQWDAFFATHDESREQTVDESFRNFIVYMNIAVGMLLSREPGVDVVAGSLHAAAMNSFKMVMDSDDPERILECMLSLVIYSFFSPLGGSAWHLIGLAMQKSISFGFHREPPMDTPPSTQNYRRCLFWSLYTLDRTISSVMDRPFSIEDADISLQYSADDSNSADFAIQIVAHARLVSSRRRYQSRGLTFHYSNLNQWREAMSYVEAVSRSKGKAPSYIKQLASRALLQTSQVKMRSSIWKAGTVDCDLITTSRDFIDEAYQRSEKGTFPGSFIDAFDIFAAGVAVVCIPRIKQVSAVVGESFIISKCAALLTILGERFPALRVFCRIIWTLSSFLSEGLLRDPILQNPPSIVPGTVQSLLKDFFRTQPGLDPMPLNAL
ncbi:hypothetical protein MW887_012088 [Aspergillus wentii]|nr:hypothetical protein MW887_012088 [Aspergillus wentii]